MNAALLTLTSLVVAGLFGFLWYLLSRQGARMDGLDERLRGVEGAMAHLEERFGRLEGRLDEVQAGVNKLLDKLQDLDSRLDQRRSY